MEKITQQMVYLDNLIEPKSRGDADNMVKLYSSLVNQIKEIRKTPSNYQKLEDLERRIRDRIRSYQIKLG